MRKRAADSRQDSGPDPVPCLLSAAFRRVPVALLLLAGCQLLNPSNYFPLGFGFHWTYRAFVSAWTSGQESGTTVYDSIETTVLGVFDTADKSGWKVETRSTHARPETAYYVQATDRLLAGDSPTDPNPALAMMLPLIEGLTWVRESTARAGKVTMLVEGRDSLRISGASTSDVWRLKQTCQSLPESLTTFWFANGIGLARESIHTVTTTPAETTTVVSVRELSDYRTD